MNHTLTISMPIPAHEKAHFSPRYGCIVNPGVKAFANLEDEVIQCNSGYLWVTLEGDTKDYILMSGQRMIVSDKGKVLIGGSGCYRISEEIDGMDLLAS